MTASSPTRKFRKRLHATDVNVPFDHELRDFRNFLFVVWKEVGLPEPTPLQYDMADFMQRCPDRAMVQAFRGASKSFIADAFVAWCLLLNPNLKIELVSASKDLSDANAYFIHQIINEVSICEPLRGEGRQSASIFDVAGADPSKDPSVKAVGIFGQITGTRADLLIFDDVEVPRTSETPAARLKLANRIGEAAAILKPGGKTLYLGTPQNDQSVYMGLEDKGYFIRVWPARRPHDEAPYKGALAPFVTKGFAPGEPIEPLRFDEADLAGREFDWGTAGFRLQFMLDVTLSDDERYPLRAADLIVTDLDPEQNPAWFQWGSSAEQAIGDIPCLGRDGDGFYKPMAVDTDTLMAPKGLVMAVDPSGKGKDETAFAVVAAHNGFFLLLDAGGIPGGYDDTVLQALVDRAKALGVRDIKVEENFGGGMFAKLLQGKLQEAGHRAGVEEVRHSRQKELRIADTLEPVMNRHRLVVDRQVLLRDYKSVQGRTNERAREYSLVFQMTRLAREKDCLVHDDRLDALAMAVAHFADQAAQDARKLAEKESERRLREELDEFMRDSYGNPVRPEGPGRYLNGPSRGMGKATRFAPAGMPSMRPRRR